MHETTNRRGIVYSKEGVKKDTTMNIKLNVYQYSHYSFYMWVHVIFASI